MSQLQDCLGEGGRVRGWDQKPVFPVPHELRYPAHVSGDHRQVRRHRRQNGRGQPFRKTGQNEQVERLEVVERLALETRELDTSLETSLSNLVFQGPPA